MRRDYFICIFLLCICVSLSFVCFTPIYFGYNMLIPREFSIFEMIMSWIFAVAVILIVPLYSAIHKKFWFTAGLAMYGLFADLPEWILPKLVDKVAGDDASIVAVIENYILRATYSMVKAPFAAMSPALGDKFARNLSCWILPVSVGMYVVVKLFRFYRDAYVADQLNPSNIIDSTAAENNSAAVASRRREARQADILGTVISAPVGTSGQTMTVSENQVGQAVQKTSQVYPVNPNQQAPSKIPAPARDNGATQQMPPVRQPNISSDTQVIRLGPPQSDK